MTSVPTGVRSALSGSRLAGIVGNRQLILFPAFTYLLVFLFVPFGVLALISLFTYDPNAIFEPTATLENYTKILGDSYYRQWFVYTVRLGFIVTAICLLLGYPLGYQLAHTSPKWRKVLLFAVLLPIIVGTIVRTYGWLVILGTEGLVNNTFLFFRETPVEFLNSTGAVILGIVGVVLPFMVLPVYSSFQNIDESLPLAARNLGANSFQAFYKVTLPLTLSGIVTGSIFTFVVSMSTVVTPQILGGLQDVTIGVLIYRETLTNFNWPAASAMAVTITAINFLLVLFYITVVGQQVEAGR